MNVSTKPVIHFLLLNLAAMAVDGVVTPTTMSLTGINVFSARLAGVLAAIALTVLIASRKPRSPGQQGFLLPIISIVSLIGGYALFAMLLARNPDIQWFVAFTSSSFAALLLAGLGYWRALAITKGPR